MQFGFLHPTKGLEVWQGGYSLVIFSIKTNDQLILFLF